MSKSVAQSGFFTIHLAEAEVRVELFYSPRHMDLAWMDVARVLKEAAEEAITIPGTHRAKVVPPETDQ